ncbi:MAG: magnesium transporter MgtE N-terminal domain-containing protein, partial [Syntrophothermus sp.]
PVRPRVIAVKIKIGDRLITYDFSSFEIKRFKQKLQVVYHESNVFPEESITHQLWLKENFLDKQIVDINGRKLVRVNDIRMVMIPSGTYALAVDVGVEGLFRRLGIYKPIQKMLEPLRIAVPGKMILWDDIEAVDFNKSSITISTASSRLHTLHPSDIADIIEDLDKATRTSFFASLDEEKAADVLEELEPEAQIDIVESLPIEKVADVLEKMPADEVADLLDVIEEDRARQLLNEMERESSEEVRELLEYPDKEVGSIMSTDFYTFPETMTVGEVISQIRVLQPEPSDIYSVFVVDKSERLLANISLMELIIADPSKFLHEIMDPHPVSVFDEDKVDILAEILSKYSLLSVPVINKSRQMEGVVVVEDIVEDLLNRRKTT